MLLSYPGIFYFNDEGCSSVSFQVYFSDLDGMTQGESIPDAIPKWADKLGKELHLNFSKTLKDAIFREKFEQ